MTLYAYDAFDRLVKIEQGADVIENVYTADGKKLSRTTNGNLTYYVYDGNVVIEEQDSENDESARNVYGRNLITRETSDGVVVYAYNGHSDVVAICNLDGDVLVTYTYDEFGNLIDETVVDEDYANFDNPYRYVGYEYIEEVELYDLNARYYNPEIARFLSPDPYYNLGNRVIGLYEINVPSAASIMQANNLYAYCGNTPFVYIDPSGEIAITTIILIGSIVVGTVAAGYTAHQSYKYTGKIDWQATIINGLSWGMMAYTMGMSAYAVYVDYCHYYGKTPVSEVSFSNTQKFLQESANSVKSSTTGHLSGTKQHTEFKNIIDSSGKSSLKTEVSFLNGEEVKYGTKGSIRFDVVEYDAKGDVVAAYDLKTGSASLTPERIAEMRKHVGSDIPIFEIKPE